MLKFKWMQRSAVLSHHSVPPKVSTGGQQAMGGRLSGFRVIFFLRSCCLLNLIFRGKTAQRMRFKNKRLWEKHRRNMVFTRGNRHPCFQDNHTLSTSPHLTQPSIWAHVHILSFLYELRLENHNRISLLFTVDKNEYTLQASASSCIS